MRTLLCDNCLSYIGGLPAGGEACLAYPAGIPQPILTGAADHRLPYPGDGGMRYTPALTLPLDPPDARPVYSDGASMP